MSPFRFVVPGGQRLCLIQVLSPAAKSTHMVLNKCLLHKWMEEGDFYVILTSRLISRWLCPQGLNRKLGKKKMTNSLAWNKVNITKSYIIHETVSFYSWRYLKFHQKLTFDTSITCFPLSELQIVFVTCIHFCLGDQKAWPENRLLGMARRSSSPDIAHVKLVVPWGKYFVETQTN